MVLALPSALVGLVVGLLGGGGAGLSVPLLVYGFGLAPKQAVATSLLVVGTSSATGAVHHAIRRRVHWRLGLLLASVAVVTAFFAGRVSHLLPDTAILLLMAGLLTLSGVGMLRSRPQRAEAETDARPILARGLLIGLGLGLVTGFLGAGGGLLAIPALVLIGRLDMRTAVGTALTVVAASSLAALLGSGALVQIDGRLALGAAAAAAAGSGLGILVARRMRTERLRRLVGVFALGMAALLVGGEVTSRLIA
jgi:uncharacterized protein